MGILPWQRQFGQLVANMVQLASISMNLKASGIPGIPAYGAYIRRCSLGALPAAYYAAHVHVMHGEKLLRAEKPQSCKFRKRGSKDSC